MRGGQKARGDGAAKSERIEIVLQMETGPRRGGKRGGGGWEGRRGSQAYIKDLVDKGTA